MHVLVDKKTELKIMPSEVFVLRMFPKNGATEMNESQGTGAGLIKLR